MGTPSLGAQGTETARDRVGEGTAWRIRRGSAPDHDAVRQLYETVYGTPRSLENIRWLYEANPAGPCELWLAEEDATRRIVSVRPVLPWRVCVGGRELLAAQAGDAMTHPDFRGRGIFTALVERAWSALRDRGVPFTFSFSNPGALSVYKKTTAGLGPGAGTYEVLHFQRMVYPVSLRPLLERVPGVGALSGLADWVYAALHGHRRGPDLDLSLFPVGRFGREFDALWARIGHTLGVLTVRDSRHLNWRFIDTPGGAFRVLGLARRGEAAGYVAFEVDRQGHGWIADLLCPPEPDAVGRLVGGALTAMAEARCSRASIWVARENSVFGVIREMGFIPRGETAPLAVHVYRAGPEAEAALDGHRWWAWYGDRDIEHLADD